ncbi:MAG: hypothetical protein ACOYL3_07145 [Desulfuromonadaceae bacterium]
MKVYKEIEFYTDGGRSTCEVAFYLDADDVRLAIEDNPKDGEQAVLRSFSDFIRFFNAVPDDIYSGFNEHQRKIIGDNLGSVLAKVKGNSVV